MEKIIYKHNYDNITFEMVGVFRGISVNESFKARDGI